MDNESYGTKMYLQGWVPGHDRRRGLNVAQQVMFAERTMSRLVCQPNVYTFCMVFVATRQDPDPVIRHVLAQADGTHLFQARSGFQLGIQDFLRGHIWHWNQRRRLGDSR